MTEEEVTASIEAAGGERVSFRSAAFDCGSRWALAVEFYKDQTRFRHAVRCPSPQPGRALPILKDWALERLTA